MTRNSKKIAITGGIGSGKSEVGKILSSFGYFVNSCDEVYSCLLQDKAFQGEILHLFPGAVEEDGNFSKKKLSKIVFSDRDALNALTKLTNPKILKTALIQMPQEGVCFCEVPLLFENGYESLFDDVLVVTRNVPTRVEAVMKRTGVTREEALSRIESQFDYDNADLSKYIQISNDGTLEDLTSKIKSKVLNSIV